MDSLNDRCLSIIFNNLKIVDQAKLSTVCKRWFELIKSINSNQLILYHSKSVKIQTSSVLIKSSSNLNKLLCSSLFKKLKKLKIHINNQLINVPLIDLSNLIDLEHLEINYFSTNQLMIDNLIQKQVQLINLRIYNCCRIADLVTLFEVFPNLTHIKTAFIDKFEDVSTLDRFYNLEYFEHYHYSIVDRNLVDFLIKHCPLIERLTLSLNNLAKISYMVQRFTNLKEINLNIPNENLKFCFKYKETIFRTIANRGIMFRINGLIVKQTDINYHKFKIDPDELFLITYEKLSKVNELVGYDRSDLEFYFNNFKEIEIIEKTILPIKALFLYNLNLNRIRKMTYHFRNRNSCNYFFDVFFKKMPNIEHLFIAEVEKISEDHLNKLPILFPKLANLELHAYEPISFPIQFIGQLTFLQTLVIQSNGFLGESLHEVVKDLQFLTNFEIDPIYSEIIDYVQKKSNQFKEIRCHLHPFSSEIKTYPIRVNEVCRERHAWFDDHIFEEFN